MKNTYVDVSLKINNETIDDIIRLEIVESLFDKIPYVLISFRYRLNKMEDKNNLLFDGALIDIIIESGTKDVREYLKFILSGIESISYEGKDTILVSLLAIPRCLPLLQGSFVFNKKASTSEICRDVCRYLKIDSFIDTTRDTQLWCSNGVPTKKFLDEIEKYAIADDLSLMKWFIRRDGTFHYRDILKLLDNSEKEIFSIHSSNSDSKSNNTFCDAITISNKSGRDNVTGGYGVTVLGNSFDSQSYTPYTCKRMKVMGKNITIDRNFIDDNTRTIVEAMDTGNFHKDYYKARANNLRLEKTFSSEATIRTRNYPKVLVGDTFSINTENSAYMNNKCLVSFVSTVITPNDMDTIIKGIFQGL